MNAGIGSRFSLYVALLLVTSQMGASAQSGGTSTAGLPAAVEAADDARWDLNIMNGSLRRQDGKTVPATLGNVIDYLRFLFPANLVLAPGVGQVKVGDLKLASFQWEPALDALKVASGNAFVWKRRSDRSAMGVVDPTTGLPVSASAAPSGESNGGEALIMLTLDNSGETPGPRRVVEVFNVGGYLRGLEKEKQEKNLNEIMQIVEVTLSDFDFWRDGVPSLRFKFHSGASLLVVSGSPGEVDVARKVILALPETSSSKAQSSSALESAQDVLRRRVERFGVVNPAPPSQPEPPAGVVTPAPPPTPKR